MRKPPEPPQGLTAVDPREWMRAWARVMALPSVKNVGAWCAHFADYRTGANIRPGIPLLMKVSGHANKAVGDALRQMREWDLLWRYYEAARSGIPDDADAYRLTFPDDISAIPMLSPDWEAPEPAACGQPRDHLSSRQVHVDGEDPYHLSSRQVVGGDHMSSRQVGSRPRLL